MQILIKPFDTLFFKNGRPFDLGNETFAESNLFINPITIHGALVSTYLSQYNLDFNKYAEIVKSNLKIKFISLMDDKSLLFPAPLDMVKDKNIDRYEQLELLNIVDKCKKVITGVNQTEKLFLSEKEVDKRIWFVKKLKLKKYLNLEEEVFNYIDIENVLKTEYKIGIGLNKKTKTVEEGLLYRMNFIRLLENTFIFVDFEINNLKEKNLKYEKGYLKLGGEGKVAWYEKVKEDYENSLKVEKTILNNGYFKLYLLTPAIFDRGHISSWMEGKIYNDLNIELVGLTMEKHINIGGFDLKNKRPKKLYKAVPAGSVFVFRTSETPEKIIDTFHLKSISDMYKNQGLGISLVGGVKK